jgi:hypothetical protein
MRYHQAGPSHYWYDDGPEDSYCVLSVTGGFGGNERTKHTAFVTTEINGYYQREWLPAPDWLLTALEKKDCPLNGVLDYLLEANPDLAWLHEAVRRVFSQPVPTESVGESQEALSNSR